MNLLSPLHLLSVFKMLVLFEVQNLKGVDYMNRQRKWLFSFWIHKLLWNTWLMIRVCVTSLCVLLCITPRSAVYSLFIQSVMCLLWHMKTFTCIQDILEKTITFWNGEHEGAQIWIWSRANHWIRTSDSECVSLIYKNPKQRLVLVVPGCVVFVCSVRSEAEQQCCTMFKRVYLREEARRQGGSRSVCQPV